MITVVVCSHDRAGALALSLGALHDVALPPGGVEVLLVDNASTDDTWDVAGRLGSGLPGFRAVQERALGLSHARNRGVAEARGDIVAFLDDDAEPDPGWLVAMEAAFADPAVVAVGGRVRLAWPAGHRPAWLPAWLEPYYSCIDLGDEGTDLVLPGYPVGANMALRRSQLERHGGFAVELGRRGGDLLSNEEKELFTRVADDGGLVRYAPDASVDHHVLVDRVRVSWILRRVRDQGRANVVAEGLAGDTLARRTHVGTAARALVRASVRRKGKLLVELARGGGTPAVVGEAARSAYWWGLARAHLAAARAGAPPVAPFVLPAPPATPVTPVAPAPLGRTLEEAVR